MSNKNKKNEHDSAIKRFTISMHCITLTFCILGLTAKLPEDFDKCLLDKTIKLAENCDTCSDFEELLKCLKELEQDISDYPVDESTKDAVLSYIRNFDKIK